MESEPQENSDLLARYNKDSAVVAVSAKDEEVKNEANPKNPPDGGFRAIMVVLGSFITNGLMFGLINSYSVINDQLANHLTAEGVQNAKARAALVGSLTMGTTFFLSPLSGVLTGLLGLRLTAFIGGSIATLGLLISSFAVYEVDVLCFTYGILYGLGASLAYTPSLAILGHYFKKYLGVVNGFVTVGSSIFTVFMPVVMEYLIKNYGLEWMYRVLAVLTFGIALCGLLFKPISVVVLEKPLKKEGTFEALLRSIVNVKIWKNRKYRYWAMSIPIALFGYFVPYVHTKKFVELNFKDSNTNLPLQCMAIASGVGRLVFGFLADVPKINRIFLQQISFYVIGTLTIVLPFVSSFPLLLAVSLGMGIFDGAFISLIGPIAFELCGSECAAQAIGCMLGLAATPLSVGPPVAGYLIDTYKSFTLPFVLAGLSPIVGATLMFSIHLQGRNKKAVSNTNGHVANRSEEFGDMGKSSTQHINEELRYSVNDQRI